VHEPNSEKTGGLITAISSGSHFRKEKKALLQDTRVEFGNRKVISKESTFWQMATSTRKLWRGDVILHGVTSQQPLPFLFQACTRRPQPQATEAH
jgi:hypothetical protein